LSSAGAGSTEGSARGADHPEGERVNLGAEKRFQMLDLRQERKGKKREETVSLLSRGFKRKRENSSWDKKSGHNRISFEGKGGKLKLYIQSKGE